MKNSKTNQKRAKGTNVAPRKRKAAGDITNQQLTAVSLQVCTYPPYMFPAQCQNQQFSSYQANLNYPFMCPQPASNFPRRQGCILPTNNPQPMFGNTPLNVPQNQGLVLPQNFNQNFNTPVAPMQYSMPSNVLQNPRLIHPQNSNKSINTALAPIKHKPKVTVLDFEKLT